MPYTIYKPNNNKGDPHMNLNDSISVLAVAASAALLRVACVLKRSPGELNVREWVVSPTYTTRLARGSRSKALIVSTRINVRRSSVLKLISSECI